MNKQLEKKQPTRRRTLSEPNNVKHPLVQFGPGLPVKNACGSIDFPTSLTFSFDRRLRIANGLRPGEA